MVILNTAFISSYSTLTVKYLLEVPRLDVVFCSARDAGGKIYLFLIFNERGKVYVRNGLNSTWIEITDENDYYQIRQLFREALADNSVPCYSSNNFNVKQVLAG